VDRVDQGDHVVDRSFGEDAVAQIENMACTAGGTAQNVGGAGFDFFRRREQGNRIEITLHGNIVTDGSPSLVEIDPPVQADDVAACGADLFQRSRGAGAED
jgi:hypothetical protein